MATKSSIESSVKVEVEPFKLALPTELMVTPKFMVDVSTKVSAKIYPIRKETTDANLATDIYDVRLVHTKTGKTHAPFYGGRSTFSHLHEVMQYLIDVSAQLNVKKRTKRTIEVDDSDESED